jgi:hypothetical protein
MQPRKAGFDRCHYERTEAVSDYGPVYDDMEFVGGPHDGELCPVTQGVCQVRMPYGFSRDSGGSLSRLRYCWYSRLTVDGCELVDADGVGRFLFVGFDE